MSLLAHLFLNDYCLGINSLKACTYISSSVDSNRFIPTNTYNNKKAVTIGWTGTFSSKIYLDLLRDVFLELNQLIDFKLRVIGNFQYDLPGIDLEVIQWKKNRGRGSARNRYWYLPACSG